MPTPPARLLTAARRPLRRVPALRTGRRGAVLLAVTALATGLIVGFAGPAAADPPPNPSDAQIGAAQATQAQLATQVGQLTAQLSQQQVQVQQLQAASELAEQKYALAVQQLEQATSAAASAKQDVTSAQAAIDAARSAFNASVRANFTQGGVQGGPGALLATDDPDQLLQSAAFQSYVTTHQADGIGQLDRAKVAKANADARARTAVANQATATAAADQANQDAQASAAAAQQQQQALAAQQATTQAQLATAYNSLQVLLGQRQTYNDYLAEQEREREAAAAAAAEAARQREAAAAALAAANAKSAGSSSRSSGSSSGGSSSGSSSSSSAPSGGAWTAAKGQDAANRALKWVNTPYAFAGGNYNGPTYGVCQAGAARNDCHVYGFDCSGLALYGWAPYLHMDHYAATQYRQAGRFHPSTSQLMPGDLLFYGGSASTIHHVAIYIGGGQVVQAPQSGDHVRVTNIGNMGSDYYGATRPLS